MPEASRPTSKHESSNFTVKPETEDTSKYEREPTLEELGLVSLANSIVTDELRGLNIHESRSVFPFPLPDTLLRFAESGHPSLRADENVGTINFADEKVLVADSPLLDWGQQMYHKAREILQFLILLHETIHAAGVSQKDKRGNVRRIGYWQNSQSDRILGHEHLRGFNEGVVQSLTMLWANKHAERIQKFFKIDTVEDVKAVINSWRAYKTEREIVDVITDRIADAKREEKNEVLLRISTGHFTGEMMHLRDIDRAFGKGTLRHLASLRSVPLAINTREEKEKQAQRIKESIERSGTRSEQIQNARAQFELPDAELFLYLRRKYEDTIDRAVIAVAELDSLDQTDPRATDLLSAHSHIYEIQEAAKYALLDIRKEKKAHGGESSYDEAVYENFWHYAMKKRSLIRTEMTRLNIKLPK